MSAHSSPEKLLRLNWRERPFGAAVNRLLGIVGDAGNATGNKPGNEAGQQYGLQAGLSNGLRDGTDNVSQAGGQPGLQTVLDDGFQGGGNDGPQPGNEDGNEYGFQVGRIGDTLVDLEPGQEAPPDAEDHAVVFLTWLQGTDAAGNWVRRSLLERLYAGPFIDDVQLPHEAWQTVARHFRKLSGVKVRQKDLRGAAYREGSPSTVTDYWIPKRSASVVKLFAAEHKRA
jgi:hypothetical protein